MIGAVGRAGRAAFARLGPLPGERVLAAARTTGGEWVVATTARLGVLPEAGDGIVGRWTEVEHVRLDGRAHTLTIEWNTRPTLSVVAGLERRHRRATSVISERVTASIVAASRVPVAGGTVRVALRRDGTKRLFLQVVAPPGVDLSDPSTAWAVRRAEVDLREAAGLEGQPTPAPTVPAPPAVTS